MIREAEVEIAEEGERSFAFERDLRNYLVKDFLLIQPGLHLYQKEGLTGVEFPAGGQFIDILAVDQAGVFVVVELKVSRGYDRVIGSCFATSAGSNRTWPQRRPSVVSLSPTRLPRPQARLRPDSRMFGLLNTRFRSNYGPV